MTGKIRCRSSIYTNFTKDKVYEVKNYVFFDDNNKAKHYLEYTNDNFVSFEILEVGHEKMDDDIVLISSEYIENLADMVNYYVNNGYNVKNYYFTDNKNICCLVKWKEIKRV